MAPPASSRVALPEEPTGSSLPLLKSRVWRISTEDEEELQLSPFQTDSPATTAARTAAREVTLGSVKVAQDVHKYTNSKRIELESPSWSGLVRF